MLLFAFVSYARHFSILTSFSRGGAAAAAAPSCVCFSVFPHFYLFGPVFDHNQTTVIATVLRKLSNANEPKQLQFGTRWDFFFSILHLQLEVFGKQSKTELNFLDACNDFRILPASPKEMPIASLFVERRVQFSNHFHFGKYQFTVVASQPTKSR